MKTWELAKIYVADLLRLFVGSDVEISNTVIIATLGFIILIVVTIWINILFFK